jgi:hypothetical protein
LEATKISSRNWPDKQTVVHSDKWHTTQHWKCRKRQRNLKYLSLAENIYLYHQKVISRGGQGRRWPKQCLHVWVKVKMIIFLIKKKK